MRVISVVISSNSIRLIFKIKFLPIIMEASKNSRVILASRRYTKRSNAKKVQEIFEETLAMKTGGRIYHDRQILAEGSIDTPQALYEFKFILYVDEKTYKYMDSVDDGSLKGIEILDYMEEVARERIYNLLPYKKCVKCNCNPTSKCISSGYIDDAKALVPTLVAAVLPVCDDCRQDALNSILDASGVHIDAIYKVCADCGKYDKKMQCCERCRSVFYCCRDCQVRDWKSGHKKECRPYHSSKKTGSKYTGSKKTATTSL